MAIIMDARLGSKIHDGNESLSAERRIPRFKEGSEMRVELSRFSPEPKS